MSINLEKGAKVDLTKGASSKKFLVGLGWNLPPQQGANTYDLDVSALICKDENGSPVLLSPAHFVYYNNLASPDGSVTHTGDNLTGAGDGDDEVLMVDLDKIDPAATEISIMCTIHNAAALGQNFGGVKDAYIHVCEVNPDGTQGTELMKYDLAEDYSMFTAVQFGSIYKKGTEWKFDAVGAGFKADLAAILSQYGQTA